MNYSESQTLTGRSNTVSEYLVKIIIAGILFGVWPLLIGKSGLGTGTATALFSTASFLILTSFALANGVGTLSGQKWWWAIIAGSMAALGVLAFNDVMIKAKNLAPMMFVIMLVIQVTIPAAYHVAANQQFSSRTLIGFAAAIVACILLSR